MWNQDQDDEFEALSSIFSDDLKVLPDKAFQLLCRVNLGQPIHTEFNSLASSDGGNGSKRRMLGFLPPIELTIFYHPEYPQEPPNFTISCLWLNAEQLSRVCGQLDALADTKPGEVCVFDWQLFLQDESLNFLGIGKQYVFEEVLSADFDCDPRVRVVLETGTANFEADLMELLVEHDMAEERRQLRTQMQECSVCALEDLGAKFHSLQKCKHIFCNDCLKEHCEAQIGSGSVDIKCMDRNCKQTLLVSEIREFVGDETFKKFDVMGFQKCLEGMGDVAWCPRAHCSAPVVIASSDNQGFCPICSFSFCSLCNLSWHHGECMSAEDKISVIEARSKKSTLDDRRATLAKILELRSEAQVLKSTKGCPACGSRIVKTEGCNKMVCRCGTMFCWLCLEVIFSYSHFGASLGLCPLFSDDNEHPQAVGVGARPPGRRRPPRDELGVNPARFVDCPKCKARCRKESNNNHLRCWHCSSQFCFTCRKAIFGTRHFSPTGCPQHSPLEAADLVG